MTALYDVQVEIVRTEVGAATDERNQKQTEIEQWTERIEEKKKKVGFFCVFSGNFSLDFVATQNR